MEHFEQPEKDNLVPREVFMRKLAEHLSQYHDEAGDNGDYLAPIISMNEFKSKQSRKALAEMFDLPETATMREIADSIGRTYFDLPADATPEQIQGALHEDLKKIVAEITKPE